MIFEFGIASMDSRTEFVGRRNVAAPEKTVVPPEYCEFVVAGGRGGETGLVVGFSV